MIASISKLLWVTALGPGLGMALAAVKRPKTAANVIATILMIEMQYYVGYMSKIVTCEENA